MACFSAYSLRLPVSEYSGLDKQKRGRSWSSSLFVSVRLLGEMWLLQSLDRLFDFLGITFGEADHHNRLRSTRCFNDKWSKQYPTLNPHWWDVPKVDHFFRWPQQFPLLIVNAIRFHAQCVWEEEVAWCKAAGYILLCHTRILQGDKCKCWCGGADKDQSLKTTPKT